MQSAVIYDSEFGNTKEVAEAIAEGLGAGTAATAVGDAGSLDLAGVSLLIVGSPTQAGRPLPSVQAYLAKLPKDALKGKEVAAFDTRVTPSGLMRLLLGIIGYAAPKLSKALVAEGGKAIVPPEGFIVEGKEGPLKAGEKDRAIAWARKLKTSPVR